MLDVADVAPYLQGKGLLGARAVVDGGLRVADVSRKNRVFLVTADDEPCYVVKLPDEAGDSGVAHEAAVLQRLRAEVGDGPLAAFLPTLVAYDAAEEVLVLEAPPAGQDLAQQHARGRFSRALAREAGQALGLLHSVAPSALDGLDPPDPSWAVTVHRLELPAMRTLTAAGVELVRMVQDSGELCDALDELHASWQTTSVIHGDVRWDNCLAVRRSGSQHRTRLLLIDWELSAAGDPAFDVGAYFGEYVRAWARLGHELMAMQPALAMFWEAYGRRCGRPAVELSRLLRRATRFAGAHVVMAALEEAQTLTELRTSVRTTLQVGANVLQQPDEAAAHLLGFRTPWGRA